MSNIATLESNSGIELIGPYECPLCGGHFSVDVTYLDQVSQTINCMYCQEEILVKPIVVKEETGPTFSKHDD